MFPYSSFRRQLDEVRENGIGRGASQFRRQRTVDSRGDFLRRRRTAVQRFEDLRVALRPMPNVCDEHGFGIVDERPVPRQQPARLECSHARQRLQIRCEIAAPTGRDHHRAAQPREIAAEHIVLVTKAAMVDGVPGRVNRGQRPVTCRYHVPIGDGRGTTAELADPNLRPPCDERGNPAAVVGMPVGYEQLFERPPIQLTSQVFDVLLFADSGVDERRHGAGQKIGVVARGSGPRGRIVRWEEDDLHGREAA